MDFDLPEAHRLLRDSVLSFSRNEIGPRVEQMEADGMFPPDLWSQLGDLGVLGVGIPEECGGSGLDLLAGVVCIEQIARVSGSVALSYGAHTNLCAQNLLRNGSDRQRQTYLPALCSGSAIGALAITEPEAGSDAVSLQLRAVRDGDDYVLNGTKMFITNGPVAQTLIVYAKTDPSANSHGISAFIVESGFAGFSVSRKLEKFGHRASPTGELVFDDCRVPAGNLLGLENEGVAVMFNGLDSERIFLSGEPLGIAEEALQMATAYAKQRKQFGRPIGDFQMIQSKLADMYTSIEAARLLTYRAAVRWQQGAATSMDAAAAILFSAEMATRVCLETMQIQGGYGYLNESPIGRMLADAKLLEIGAGTSEIRRMIIARELLN
ncbi:MAG: isovaleryl-CoA dehydrogenase [Dehalococcoidia bacterium]|nr:isovaleryl-CoA dehydrogenase [Dehalococcoidia bacterium]